MALGVGDSADRARRMLPPLSTNWRRVLGVRAGPRPVLESISLNRVRKEVALPFDLDGRRIMWSYTRSPYRNNASLSFFGDSYDSLKPRPIWEEVNISHAGTDRNALVRTFKVTQELRILLLFGRFLNYHQQSTSAVAKSLHQAQQCQQKEGEEPPHFGDRWVLRFQIRCAFTWELWRRVGIPRQDCTLGFRVSRTRTQSPTHPNFICSAALALPSK